MKQTLRPREESQQRAANTARPPISRDGRDAPAEVPLPIDNHPAEEGAFRHGTLRRKGSVNMDYREYRDYRKGDEVTIARGYQTIVERLNEVKLDPSRVDPHLVGINEYDPRAAQHFNQLAVSLIVAGSKRSFRRLLIASAQHAEGRTSVALNLAAALARARRRVLLLDCDLLQPSALRLLGIDTEIGLAEALADGLPLTKAVTRVQPAGFDLLAARERVANSAALLASVDFGDLLDRCDQDYDFILMDSPPLLGSPDAHLLVAMTDTTLLVIRPGRNNSSQMAKALALFTAEDLCGVVLNRVTS